MKKTKFFVKSFEEDFILKTMHNKEKVTSQSVQEIIKSEIITPNTESFGQNKRLACTYLTQNYYETYREQGFIFSTKEVPDHIYPFDLAVLTKNNDIIVEYYKIENDLDVYYSHVLIDDYKLFLFKTFEEMIQKIPSPEVALKEVNKIRKKHGFKELSKDKIKLLTFNETVFERKIKVEPIGIYGSNLLSKEIAKQFNLPHFKNAKEFVVRYVIK